MKTIGFVGTYDKIDTIMYIAKLLSKFGKKVLVIDSSRMQKARYIIPVIAPTRNYVTNYEGFDIAVGFDTMNQIKGYLGKLAEDELDYDILMVDVDDLRYFENFEIEHADNIFFATGFDAYTLKGGLEILEGLNQPIPMTKLLFANKVIKEDDEYLNFLSKELRIVWNENIISVITSDLDTSVFSENQRVARMKYKNLTNSYKESLAILVMTILPDVKINDVMRILKIIDKGV